MIQKSLTEYEDQAKRQTLQLVKWWKVAATRVDESSDGEFDGSFTFYMRSVFPSTAIKHVKAALSVPFTHISAINIEEVPQPPDGCLYSEVTGYERQDVRAEESVRLR